MSRKEPGSPESFASFERRAREAEQRCEAYRRAFLLLLSEPFENLDDTLNRMLEVLATTLDVERVSYWAFTHNDEAIECHYQYTRAGAPAAAITRIDRRNFPNYFEAVSSHLAICADDARVDVRTCDLAANYLEPLGITSMLDVPVRAFGRCIGVLCHEHTGKARRWLPDDQHFASGVATQVALAHERARNRKAQEDVLARSLRDEESQLPNVMKLDGAIDEALAACISGRAPGAALIVVSVDQFQHVAAALGTQRMRDLVRQFAANLVAATPAGGTAARIAQNEFAILIPEVSQESVESAVQKTIAPLSEPLESNGRRVFITVSAGYTWCHPRLADSVGQLRTEARLAAQAAQAAGGERARPFSSEMREQMLHRIRMEQDLRRALEEKEFALEFQPIVEIDRHYCKAVEALVRWRHPQRGLLLPEQFMAVAIDAGIMADLGRRVLRAACQGVAEVRSRTHSSDLELTVNMSVPELLLSGTAEVVRQELGEAGLPASALTIEVTESEVITDLARTRTALEEIRASGVKISLDDFGTAHSSLSWLRGLPVDNLKIDRSFVIGVEHDRRDEAIVQSILGLGAAFDQTVVAEGIETSNQLRKLSQLGLRFAQGNLFAEPRAPAGVDDAWLREAGARARLS
jgi:predicted signal transduction protein with EAL and GGDEF domain